MDISLSLYARKVQLLSSFTDAEFLELKAASSAI